MTPPPSVQLNGKTDQPFDPLADGRGLDLLRWKLTSRPARWPTHVPLAPQPPPPPPAPLSTEIVATWIGHSTFLLQTPAGNFLTDPVFSDRASPVQWAGPRRVHAPGLAFDALPRIDAVLLSHDHYDHFDTATLRRLAAVHDPLFIAPLRHRDLLTTVGARRIVELDRWQSHSLSSFATVTLTPARHWSNRFGTPRNHRLWGGFSLTLPPVSVIEPPPQNVDSPPPATPGSPTEAAARPFSVTRRIWFAGDTGYDDTLFHEIRHRTGPPDLALIPIGAYEPRWFMAPMHMNPAEAVQTHCDVGARLSLAMHWGTFQLTDEAREDPPRALAAALAAAGLADDAFKVLAPGATITV